MTASKPWYASKAIWGGLVSIIGGLFALFGVDVDADALTEALLELGVIVGGVLSVVGRVTAEKRIGQ